MYFDIYRSGVPKDGFVTLMIFPWLITLLYDRVVLVLLLFLIIIEHTCNVCLVKHVYLIV